MEDFSLSDALVPEAKKASSRNALESEVKPLQELLGFQRRQYIPMILFAVALCLASPIMTQFGQANARIDGTGSHINVGFFGMFLVWWGVFIVGMLHWGLWDAIHSRGLYNFANLYEDWTGEHLDFSNGIDRKLWLFFWCPIASLLLANPVSLTLISHSLLLTLAVTLPLNVILSLRVPLHYAEVVGEASLKIATKKIQDLRKGAVDWDAELKDIVRLEEVLEGQWSGRAGMPMFVMIGGATSTMVLLVLLLCLPMFLQISHDARSAMMVAVPFYFVVVYVLLYYLKKWGAITAVCMNKGSSPASIITTARRCAAQTMTDSQRLSFLNYMQYVDSHPFGVKIDPGILISQEVLFNVASTVAVKVPAAYTVLSQFHQHHQNTHTE